jgi:predicted extracellular nuclease
VPIHKQLALVLAFTLAFQNISYASSTQNATQPLSQINKAKAEIQKYDAKKNEVKVTLHSGKDLKGYISRSDDMSFELTEKSGRVSKLNYEDVNKVHGAGLSRGAKVAIVAGIALGVVVAVFAVALKKAGF